MREVLGQLVVDCPNNEEPVAQCPILMALDAEEMKSHDSGWPELAYIECMRTE
jgi:hypothetical protein